MNRELYKDIDFKKNLKHYLDIVSKYKWTYISILIVTGVIEGLRVFDRYLFKVVLDKGAEYTAGTLLRSSFVSILLALTGIYFGALFIKLALNHGYKARKERDLMTGMVLDIKTKFFNHILHLSHRFHTTHKTGSLISRMNRGTGAAESLTDFIIDNITPLIFQIAIVSVSLLFLDWVSAVVILVTSTMAILWGIAMANARKKSHVALNQTEDREKGSLADILTNIESVKYYGKENLIKQKYANLATTSQEKMKSFWNYGILFNLGNSFLIGLGTFFLIYFPVKGFLDGNVTIGTLTFIYTTYLGLMGPLMGFVYGIRRYYKAVGDFDTLFSYSEITNDIVDEPNSKKLKITKGEIELKDISFKYHDRNILDNISLKVKPGEKIALVGHSGSGKTTLIKLLYRLYDVQNGQILIDGKNIKTFKQESLRGELSIVPQECVLFDDSIYNNILFSNPKATREEVFKAIKFAQLDVFVNNLPEKENTIVGERGVKLSGGERQRVSIARAILANKKVLVLDEATSSLDSQTEFEIQKDLEKLMKGRTSIIIAHRLSTIMKVDKIIVMNKGRIAQTGKHNDLIKKPGIYKHLWNLQKGGYLKE
ncbi:MAG: ABC transporter ATP-binding protein [archaeon]